MFRQIFTSIATSCLSLFICSSAWALDARTAALGGSAIANGEGVHGALENPSSLMHMNRDDYIVAFHLGGSTDIRDNARILETALEKESLPNQIEGQIEALSGREITCALNSPPETACLSGTETLGDLSAQVLEILERFDGQPFNATVASNAGIAFTKSTVPVAVHFKASATGAATVLIADEDKNYVDTFATVLSDDQLTYEELISAIPLTISTDGTSINVLQPEDALQSDVAGSVLTRQQLGLSMATSFNIAGNVLDLGITPKFSKLTATSLTAELNDHFNEETDSFPKQFKSNENVGSAWNVDFGATLNLKEKPVSVSVVARNIRTESIATKENFVFETTPQFIVGGALKLEKITVSADMALNNAKVDNMETQIMAAGIEYKHKFYALRAGFSHDNARRNDASAISLGLSVGPLHIGGRVTNRNAAQAGAQLSFSY